jgi:hypothetical protein
MSNYLDKAYLNKVMFECKKKGRLTREALNCFELLATKVSSSYDYRNDDDRKDAIAFATNDFAAYWKNYKINPVVQIKFTRNIFNGEEFILRHNGKEYKYVAKLKPENDNEFAVHQKVNKTIEELHKLLERDSDGTFYTTIHKVTRKLAVVDLTCYENSVSELFVDKKVGSKICDDDVNPHIGISRFVFGAPPPAFNFLTSVARNGLFKATKVLYSDSQKMMVNFSRLNRANGGVYNE